MKYIVFSNQLPHYLNFGEDHRGSTLCAWMLGKLKGVAGVLGTLGYGHTLPGLKRILFFPLHSTPTTNK